MKETVATLAQSECSKVISMKESRRIEKQAGERDEKFLLAGAVPVCTSLRATRTPEGSTTLSKRGSPVARRSRRTFTVATTSKSTCWTGSSPSGPASVRTRRRYVPATTLLSPPVHPTPVHVTRSGPGRALVVASPSAFARLIAQIGTPDEGEQPPSSTATETDLLLRLSAEAGDEILGPPGALPDFRQSSAPK